MFIVVVVMDACQMENVPEGCFDVVMDKGSSAYSNILYALSFIADRLNILFTGRAAGCIALWGR